MNAGPPQVSAPKYVLPPMPADARGAIETIENLRSGRLPTLDGLGVVSDVIDYMAERRTDVAEPLRAWTAITVCGAVLGTKVYARPWGRPFHPNLIGLIIAPSGAGKGDTMGDAEDVFEAAVPGHLLPQRFSSAGWDKALREAQGWGLVVVDEGDELLKRTRMDAFADIVGLLCRSYDGRVTRESILSREPGAPLASVAPSVLIAIQPSALQAGVIESSHVLSGLLGRAVIVSADRPPRRVLLNEEGGAARQPEVVKGLRTMAGIVGWTKVSDSATPALEILRYLLEHDHPTDELAGAHARVTTLAVKLATIFQASLQAENGRSGAPDPIEGLAMTAAMELAYWSWGEAKRVFSQDVSYDRNEARLQRVVRAIRKRGGVDVASGEVLRALSGVSARDLDGMLATLEVRGEVTSVRSSTPKGGAPARLLTVIEGIGR
jgi:hypothetical protein